MALLFTFFCSRLVWGSYQSLRVAYDVYRALTSEMRNLPIDWAAKTARAPSLDPNTEIMRFSGNRPMPYILAIGYLGANLTLNGLNWIWFSKMIETVRKRFDPPLGTKGTKKSLIKEPVLVEGIDVETDADAGADGMPVSVTGQDKLGLARGIDAEGRRTVEVEKTEIRSRKRG